MGSDIELLFLGFDGLSYRILRDMSRRDPDIRRTMDRFHWGPLVSVRTKFQPFPHTGPAWTSMYTGTTPEMHGITSGGWLLDHKTWMDQPYELIWSILAESHKVGLFTMPMTFPAPKDLAWSVAGFPSPGIDKDGAFHPDDSGMGTILDAFEVDIVNVAENRKLREIFDLETCLRIPRDKVSRVDEILGRHETEVLAIGFTFTDRISHIYPTIEIDYLTSYYEDILKAEGILFGRHQPIENLVSFIWRKVNSRYPEALATTYAFFARFLDELVDRYDPKRVVIVSDHGFGLIGRERFGFHDMNGVFGVYPKAAIRQRVLRIEEIGGVLLRLLDLRAEFPRERRRKVEGLRGVHSEEIRRQLEGLGYI